MDKKCIKALVSGHVQGVFFRASTRQVVNRLGLTGHVINLADGRVEVLACGNKDDLDRLIQWLNKGPEMARVTGLKIETVTTLTRDKFSIG